MKRVMQGFGLIMLVAAVAAFNSKPRRQENPSPPKKAASSATTTPHVAARPVAPQAIVPATPVIPIPQLASPIQSSVPATAAVPAASAPTLKELTGQVVGVTDGDTITVLDEGKNQHKLRLEGIDAPESHQAYGTRSKQELSKRVYLKPVRVAVTGTDKYGRELGHVYAGDRWVNREMVEGGYAWHYKKYSSDQDLARAEEFARQNKAGLWSMPNPVAPWDFRHDSTKAATAMAVNEPAVATPRFAVQIDADAAGDAVYVTRTGEKYHAAGCRHLSKSAIPIPLGEAKGRYSPCSVCGS